MRPVIIVQGSPYGLLFVQECGNRGIEPIVVNPPEVNTGSAPFDCSVADVRTIDMGRPDEYDDKLETIKTLDPLCVVCGGNGGVALADRLSKDLNLRGNDPETTRNRDTEDGMHDALRKAGLRYMHTAVVDSEDGIGKFWKQHGVKKATMKFKSGNGATEDKVCTSAKESFNALASSKKRDDSALIQESIEGDEYVVDTVSCDGMHAVCAIWKHKMMTLPNGNAVAYETELVTYPSPGINELIRYAYKVLDATGFRCGACHGEYKIDMHGPVLIKINARMQNVSLTAEYLDEFLQSHITDVALDSYLSPENFCAYASKPYRPNGHAALKHLSFPKGCDIDIVMLERILGTVVSYRRSATDLEGSGVREKKATALAMTLKMCNTDYAQLRRDCDSLHLMNTKYPDIVAKGNDIMPRTDENTDVDAILSMCRPYMRVLVITSDGEYLYIRGRKEEVPKDMTEFDAMVYANASESTAKARLASIITNAARIHKGGITIIIPESYENLPYGSAAAEISLRIASYTIDVPQQNNRLILATRC